MAGMFRNMFIAGVILVGLIVGLQWLMEGPNLDGFAQHLPGDDTPATLDYFAGQLNYISGSYDPAAKFFKTVIEKYPKSSYAEKSRAYWIDCLSQHLERGAPRVIAECQAFLEKYPNSEWAPRIRSIQDKCERANLH